MSRQLSRVGKCLLTCIGLWIARSSKQSEIAIESCSMDDERWKLQLATRDCPYIYKDVFELLISLEMRMWKMMSNSDMWKHPYTYTDKTHKLTRWWTSIATQTGNDDRCEIGIANILASPKMLSAIRNIEHIFAIQKMRSSEFSNMECIFAIQKMCSAISNIEDIFAIQKMFSAIWKQQDIFLSLKITRWNRKQQQHIFLSLKITRWIRKQPDIIF